MDSETPPRRRETDRLAAALDAARLKYWEEPAAALETAAAAVERARILSDEALQARALCLQASVAVHAGDLRGGANLIAEAVLLAGDDLTARTEIAALNAQLHFFTGAYGPSLTQAEIAVELADQTADLRLRVYARRMGCVAFANIGVDDIEERFGEVLRLAVEQFSPWEEAICRNDIACLHMARGDYDEAVEQFERAFQIARELRPRNRFILGVLHCSHAELNLLRGNLVDATRDAGRAVAHVLSFGAHVNPYLLAMSVLMEVRALLALGQVGEARYEAEAALERLGDRVPQARSMILTDVANALREHGQSDEAFDMLARGIALERQALQEFAQLRSGLERAQMEMAAARRQADALAVKNRQLQGAIADLHEAREQLRELVERDPLTGLHNRRFLARARSRTHHETVSFAAADIDFFKSINDRFGHTVGDQVLVRVAELLVSHLRVQDVVVRTGGEEFALLMPGAEPAEAAAACERLRTVIADADWEAIAPGLAVTASFGVAFAPAGSDLSGLEEAADERLYEAKRAGRNCVTATF